MWSKSTQPFPSAALSRVSNHFGLARFSDLPVELLEKIFEHLVVLKPGIFFQDPGSADSSIQKRLANYNARVARARSQEPFGRPLVLSEATDWQIRNMVRSRILRPVDTSDLPTPPVECQPVILTVCRHFYEVAARLLYAKNDFVFRSSEALDAFVALVNQPTLTETHSRPRVGTKAIRRLFLHRRHFNSSILAYNNTNLWVQYLGSQRLVQDFPNLTFLDLDISPFGRGETLWLRKISGRHFVHPVFRESMRREMKYIDENFEHFACGVPPKV
ncbi:hypothetical protein MMC30_004751 [Trapelia coarctata]|nr:hypothetical protein [Trapelia coarctata]